MRDWHHVRHNVGIYSTVRLLRIQYIGKCSLHHNYLGEWLLA